MIGNQAESKNLTKILNQAISLRLFSNNVAMAETITIGSFTEVVGGGYVSKALVYASWVITEGSPTRAAYPVQEWVFTGATDAPGTIYGYYLVDADGVLIGAELFAAVFTPTAGSKIRITPRVSNE